MAHTKCASESLLCLVVLKSMLEALIRKEKCCHFLFISKCKYMHSLRCICIHLQCMHLYFHLQLQMQLHLQFHEVCALNAAAVPAILCLHLTTAKKKIIIIIIIIDTPTCLLILWGSSSELLSFLTWTSSFDSFALRASWESSLFSILPNQIKIIPNSNKKD